MLGVGPMRDVTIGEAVSSAPGAVAGQGSSRGPPQLVACSGQGKQGALAILRRNLVPELILKTSTPGQLPHVVFVSLHIQSGVFVNASCGRVSAGQAKP